MGESEVKKMSPVQQAIHNCKLIMSKNFEDQRNKTRSKEDSLMVGNALTAIEIDVQADLKRLIKGENIQDIIPNYDKMYGIEND